MPNGNERADALRDLARTINWTAASQTFGSPHSTLIGLVVEAWAGLGADRYILEGAPKIEKYKSDAVLAIGTDCVGVVEVEGFKILDRIQRFDQYFNVQPHILSQPAFGLVVVYQSSSSGGQCTYPGGLAPECILAKAGDVANNHPDNPLMVVLAEKRYDRNPKIALRRHNTWAWGRFARMIGCVFHQGEREEIPLWAEGGGE